VLPFQSESQIIDYEKETNRLARLEDYEARLTHYEELAAAKDAQIRTLYTEKQKLAEKMVESAEAFAQLREEKVEYIIIIIIIIIIIKHAYAGTIE
jgi:primosomal protein N''